MAGGAHGRISFEGGEDRTLASGSTFPGVAFHVQKRLLRSWCYECHTFKNAVLSYAFKFILRDLLFYFYLRVYKLSTAEQSLKGHLIAIWSHFQN